MGLVQELKTRRVPQIVSAYAVFSWGLVQVIQFLEGRMDWSPHVLNLVGLALVLLLPAVVIVAWSQGRPGRDGWGRFEKTAIPLNVLGAVVLLLVLFQGKELRALTTTVSVTDEAGKTLERQVPKAEYLKRILFFRAGVQSGPEDAWMGLGFVVALDMDLSQDPFVETRREEEMYEDLRRAGHDLDQPVPRSLQIKLAREGHFPHVLSGTIERDGAELVLLTELVVSKTGRVVESHEYRAADLFGLVDQASVDLRSDLGIPVDVLEDQTDLPAAELTSRDPEAYRLFALATDRMNRSSEWREVATLLAEALERDPSFALAHHLQAIVLATLGDAEAAAAAEKQAMANIYRLPERVQFMIKAAYYVNFETDMDKTMAVIDMWTRLYPRDPDAYRIKAQFLLLQNDVPGTIACYESILAIDPTQYEVLRQLGNLHRKSGDFERAETYLRRYADAFPTSGSSWRALASLHEDTGDLDAAVEALEKARLIDHADPVNLTRLAAVHSGRGDFDAAHHLLGQALDTTTSPTERAPIRAQLMRTLWLQGRVVEAYAGLDAWAEDAMAEGNPLINTMTYLGMMEYAVDAGRAEEVVPEIDRISEGLMSFLHPVGRMNAVPHLLALGRLEEAEARLNAGAEIARVSSMDVLLPRIDLFRGQLLRERGELEASVTALRRAVEGLPFVKEVRLELARSLIAAGEEREARDVLEQLLLLAPARGDVNLELADLERGRPSRAGPYLERALLTWTDAAPEYEEAQRAWQLKVDLAESMTP